MSRMHARPLPPRDTCRYCQRRVMIVKILMVGPVKVVEEVQRVKVLQVQ